MASPVETEHPTTEELQSFLLGKVNSQRARDLEAHVIACPDCSRTIEAQSELIDDGSIHVWTDQDPPSTGRPAGMDPVETHDDTIDRSGLEGWPLSDGQQINDYLLNYLIGEGGNGYVYHATQLKPIRRTVAVKFAKKTAAGSGSRHRFEFEHQTLAGLQHPSIPHVYDAGFTKSGIAYFVMEYIDGQQLSEYLRDHLLPVADCLALMCLLCESVQYAHRNGVIHRDLKPSNILLERDPETGLPDVGRPRVIDFGIAKNVDGDHSRMTGSREMIGTLAYMSPEQMDAKPHCDTRSDVYAMGLVFYELLAFRLPFQATELDQLALDAAIRKVRCDDPLEPSKSLSQSCDSNEISNDQRMTQQRSRQIQGEIDWIVMKAIDRDPDRRYQSAALLADDIERYVRGDLISTPWPSRRRKMLKLIHRHRGWFAASVLFLLSFLIASGIIIGLLGSTMEANEDLRFRTYIGETQIADERLSRGHTVEAIKILDRQRNDPKLKELRGLEWRLLWKEAHPDALLDQADVFHDRVDDLAVSSRSQIAAISRKYQTIKLYKFDASSLRLEGEIDSKKLLNADPRVGSHWAKHASESDKREINALTWGRNPHPMISCVEYTPDGMILAIGTYSGIVILWDLEGQKVNRLIDCGADRIERIEISDDQRWLVTVGTAVRLAKLDETSSKAKPRLIYDAEKTHRADFSSDSRYLAIANRQRSLLVWDNQTEELATREPVKVGNVSFVMDVQFSFRGEEVVYGMSNGGIYRRSWDGNSLGDVSLLGVTKNSVRQLRFAGSELLASTCDGGLLQYWDVGSPDGRRKLVDLNGHSGRVRCLEYASAEDRFITGGQDGFVRLYDARPRKQRISPLVTVTCLDVNDDSTHFAVGYKNGVIELRTTGSTEIVESIQNEGAVRSVRFSSNNQKIVATTSDPDGTTSDPDGTTSNQELVIWDINSGGVKRVKLHDFPKMLLGGLPDDGFAIGFRDGNMHVFDSDGKMLTDWEVNSKGFASAGLYRQGKQIVTCENNWLKFWNYDGELIKELPTDQDIREIVSHPTEDVLIGYGVIGRIATIDPDTGDIVREFRGHVGPVLRVIVLEGGKRLLSIGDDFTARFWDFETGTEVLMRDGGSRRYRRIATNARQDILITHFSDNTVEVVRLSED